MREVETFTVASDGHPIGTTALELGPADGPLRVGWLHPDPLGEPLLDERAAGELTLLGADGAPVPCARVELRDAHALLALAEWAAARREADDGAAPAWPPDAVRPAPADDAAPDRPWAPDDEPSERPRWQVVVHRPVAGP